MKLARACCQVESDAWSDSESESNDEPDGGELSKKNAAMIEFVNQVQVLTHAALVAPL